MTPAAGQSLSRSFASLFLLLLPFPSFFFHPSRYVVDSLQCSTNSLSHMPLKVSRARGLCKRTCFFFVNELKEKIEEISLETKSETRGASPEKGEKVWNNKSCQQLTSSDSFWTMIMDELSSFSFCPADI